MQKSNKNSDNNLIKTVDLEDKKSLLDQIAEE